MNGVPAEAGGTLPPRAAAALALWLERIEAMRDGVELPAGSYARELTALAECSDAEWAQVDAAKRNIARRLTSGDGAVRPQDGPRTAGQGPAGVTGYREP